MRATLFLCVLVGLGTPALADAPQVPTDAPYIVLSDNQDEPNGYGFCIDTVGRGQTELLQTHSCKPANADRARADQDNDTRFAYDAGTMQIISYAFEGYCMQALLAGRRNEFALLECSDHPRQKFVYGAEDQTLRLHQDQTLCVGVSDQTEAAGPWVSRALLLTNCGETGAPLIQWSVVAQ